MTDNRVIKAISRKKDYVFCVLIVLLGASLRLYYYDSVPVHNWTGDEYAFAWNGMSLIREGVPTSWSWAESYKNYDFIKWKGHDFKLVYPWFDHPPLFSLIVGCAAILGGAGSFLGASLSLIRIPSLIFSILSILLLYSLSRNLFGTQVAVLSSIIFATNPTLIFLSRLAVSENLIIFLTLAVLSCFVQFLKTSKALYLYVSIFLAGLASLAKVTGIFLVGLLALLFILNKKWREGIITLVAGLLIFSLYFIYGFMYDGELFIGVLADQARRFIDFSIFKNLILQQVLYAGNSELPYLDIWMVFSWLAFLFVYNEMKIEDKSRIIVLPVISYAFVLFICGAQSHFLLWYYIPFYPFISIILGIYFLRFMKDSDFISASLVLIFMGGWFINNFFVDTKWHVISTGLNFGTLKYIVIFAVSLLLLPFLFHSVFPSERSKLVKDAVAVSIITLFIICNIIIVYKFPNVLM